MKGRFKVECAEELHTVLGNRILFADDADMPEAKRFDEGVDDFLCEVSGRS